VTALASGRASYEAFWAAALPGRDLFPWEMSKVQAGWGCRRGSRGHRRPW
jgi:hypothetical protein